MNKRPSILDIGTIYDHGKGQWGCRIICYPNGSKEGILRVRNPASSTASGRGRLNPQAPQSGNGTGGEADESSAPRRARTAIRRFVMGAGCDRMLTLTYASNFQDRKISKHHMQLLMRRLKRKYQDSFHWLAVPEYQKRGAIHWHIAVNVRLDAVETRLAWQSIIKEEAFVHLRYFPDPSKQAGYLSKYIGKHVDDDPQRGNDKRYYCSRGLQTPELYFRADTQEQALQKFAELTGDRWNGEITEFEGTYWLPAF